MPDKDGGTGEAYRVHAEELRTIAQSLDDRDARKKLEDAAEQFEELARLSLAMSKAVKRKIET